MGPARIAMVDPTSQTGWFVFILIFALVFTFKINKEILLTKNTTLELKGFAILSVIFGHIGYFLAQDNRFLFPLSILSGVGVNLFLFLSGFGLARSSAEKSFSFVSFYRNQLPKLFIPLWITLIFFFIVDASLGIRYPWQVVFESFIGFFPEANLYWNVNAPLWYFTFILAYYLIFPLVYLKKYPWISAIIIGLLGYAITERTLPVDSGVLELYRLHIWAFPLGMLSATSIPLIRRIKMEATSFLTALRLLSVSLLCVFIAWASLNAGVGESAWKEQNASLLLTVGIIFVFLLKPFEIGFLRIFGRYSYELYLLHWPIMYRYDLYYLWLPASLATWAHLCTGLGIGKLLRILFHRLPERMPKP